jgi:hypothetical protein
MLRSLGIWRLFYPRAHTNFYRNSSLKRVSLDTAACA